MNIAVQPAPAQLSAPPRLRAALAAIGFTATVAQIILLRELFVVFNGNELSLGLVLAIWLLWTATGSVMLSRLFLRVDATRLLALLQISASAALFLSILLTRASRGWWNAIPGEVLGPIPIIITAMACLAVFCVISGCLFAAGTRAYAEASHRSTAEGGSTTYLLEAVGSVIGGVLASVIFIRFFSSLQIAVVIAGVNFVLSAWLLLARRVARVALALVLSASAAAMLYIVRPLELRSAARTWPNFQVVAVANSRYGSLAVVDTEGTRSVIQNGSVLFTVPDPAAAEESVHFPLLEHSSPRSVLLIGGGLNGSVREILKHPTVDHIDYVELDPVLLNLEREYFRAEWTQVANDPRVHTHQVDGRLFVKSVRRQYDVIIANLPEPQTAQLNRFFTVEFFSEARKKLAPAGVFAFHLRGAEEYISPETAEFLSCIHTTLKRAYPDVVIIPGETLHFLAAPHLELLTDDPQLLVQRLRERGIQTVYVREYYLPFRMARERLEDLNRQLSEVASPRVNRDFSPIAYYFDVALWSGQFSSGYRTAFQKAASIPFRNFGFSMIALAILCTVALVRKLKSGVNMRPVAGLSVALTGLTTMGNEVILLLGFQAVYGYVFDELALIIAGFMAGIAVGSWFALRRSDRTCDSAGQRLALAQIGVALSPIIVIGSLWGTSAIDSNQIITLVSHLGFPALAILCGSAGGYQFVIAMRAYQRDGASHTSPATLYGLDLAGAAVGAVAVSVYFLPVFGFARTASLVVLANVAAILPLLVSALRRRDPRTPAQ